MLSQPDMLARLGARRQNYSLDRDLYCDDGVFQMDLEHVFYREWLFAIPSCEIPKTGNFATLQVGAYPVVITRAADGMIRAFHNVCRHRGQRLCAKETGSTPKLVCPYHQWTYDLNGKGVDALSVHGGAQRIATIGKLRLPHLGQSAPRFQGRRGS